MCSPVLPALWRWRQEDYKFRIVLHYIHNLSTLSKFFFNGKVSEEGWLPVSE